MSARVAALYRYPVKGLSPEPLEEAQLEGGAYFPGDRLYAVENGDSAYDPDAPRHEPKLRYFQLMRNDALARLSTRYDDATATLSIERDSAPALRVNLSTEEGRTALGAFLAEHLGPDAVRGPARALEGTRGHRFTDAPSGFVSLLNRASVAAVEQAVGRPVDPLRFRANLLVEGWRAWEEFELVDRLVGVGGEVRLVVTSRIVRCAATGVDPATGERDMNIVRTLATTQGHSDCGVYARVVRGGRIRAGDEVTDLGPAGHGGANLPLS